MKIAWICLTALLPMTAPAMAEATAGLSANDRRDCIEYHTSLEGDELKAFNAQYAGLRLIHWCPEVIKKLRAEKAPAQAPNGKVANQDGSDATT